MGTQVVVEQFSDLEIGDRFVMICGLERHMRDPALEYVQVFIKTGVSKYSDVHSGDLEFTVGSRSIWVCRLPAERNKVDD